MKNNQSIDATESEVKDGVVVQSHNSSSEKADEKGPLIMRGKVDSLRIYEVTDYELSILENGSPNSIIFNIAIALLSTSITIFITLLTTNADNEVNSNILIILMIVSFIVGLVLLLIWVTSNNKVGKVFKKIKSRIKE